MYSRKDDIDDSVAESEPDEDEDDWIGGDELSPEEKIVSHQNSTG